MATNRKEIGCFPITIIGWSGRELVSVQQELRVFVDLLHALAELGAGVDVELAAGSRYNMVHVVSTTSDEDIAAAVELIDRIKPQIPG